MTDTVSKKTRSRIMQAIRGKDTKPELVVRKPLFKQGFRYRVNYPIGRYKIDIAFPAKKIAVFVDGCFWHGCPVHKTFPKSNKAYWLPKLKANVKRDKSFRRSLRKNGWTVLQAWEHELKTNAGLNSLLSSIFNLL